MERYSYSKLSSYKDCPYKFKLIYIDKNFVDNSSIATNFGTLIHYTEECIANDIKNNIEVDYEKYIQMFINIDDSSKQLYGVKKLKELYPNDFYKEDKTGVKYSEKCAYYVNEAIYRLETFLKQNPSLEIIGTEKEFNLSYKNYEFHGFIDRLFKDKITGNILIEDIKTYSKPLEKGDLTTPLQFVFYSLAVQQLYNINENQIKCAYDLPLCDCKQDAGTSGFIKRGVTKIDKLLSEIESNDFHPNPSPLCHFCQFCSTNVNDKLSDDVKLLCPYHSNWTKEKRTDFSVENVWMGPESDSDICRDYKNRMLNKDNSISIDLSNHKDFSNNIDLWCKGNDRYFRIRL